MQKIYSQLKFAQSLGVIHFIGIGGIGMSGIAEILHSMGYDVQGSDLSENDNVQRIRNLGIKVMIGHEKANIQNCKVLVKSSAIKDTNPEIIEAKEQKIPIIKRSEMLAEIMCLKNSIAISGSHGKTTTTSLVATLFESAKLNPTVINGGILNARDTNAYLGLGDYLIAEADESDETFIKISSTIAVITNIDPEHLDFYGTFDALKAAYEKFFANLPFYGFGVACLDHHEVRNLVSNIIGKEIVTYGIESEDVDIRAVNIKQVEDYYLYDVIISSRLNSDYSKIENINLPMAGIHNVLNSLAAIAIGVKLKFEQEVIANAFKSFQGVKRRFTKVDVINGVRIIDDYAHHPEEIKVTLKAAQSALRTKDAKVIVIMQPHRYSRIHSLFADFIHAFNDADILYISDIYASGEAPIDGISGEILVNAIRQSDKKIDVRMLYSPDKIANIVKENSKEGDIVIFLGAGTSSKWAYDLPKQLKAIASESSCLL